MSKLVVLGECRSCPPLLLTDLDGLGAAPCSSTSDHGKLDENHEGVRSCSKRCGRFSWSRSPGSRLGFPGRTEERVFPAVVGGGWQQQDADVAIVPLGRLDRLDRWARDESERGRYGGCCRERRRCGSYVGNGRMTMSSWTRRHITVDGPWPLGHQAMKLNKVLVRKSSTAHVISTSTNSLGALAKKTQPADDDANVEGGRGYLKHHQTATSATRPTMHHRTSEGQEKKKKPPHAVSLTEQTKPEPNMPNVHPKHSSPKHHVSHSSEQSSRRHRKVGDMETLVSQRHGEAGELLLRNLVEHDKDGALQCLLVHLGAM